jgi:hypothetical protein
MYKITKNIDIGTILLNCKLWAFNNISVISWWSVLLVEETRISEYPLNVLNYNL